MSANARYGLEQARIQLPAIVPIQDLQKTQPASDASGLLALRGTGRSLWGADVGQTITELRDDWDTSRTTHK